MASSMTFTLVALVVPMVFAATIKHHTLTISEKGAMFNETIDVDVQNQIVYMHVPAHRDLPESSVMYEFTTGRVLRCTPSIRRCYLSNFDTRTAVGARREEQYLKEFARKRTTPREEEALEKVTWKKMVVTERIKDTKFLTTRMRQMLGHYAVYREEPLPKGAKILKGKLDLNKNVQKRDIVFCAKFELRYGRSGLHCNHMMLCRKPKDPRSCSLRHHGRIDYYKCKCCPQTTKLSQCMWCDTSKDPFPTES